MRLVIYADILVILNFLVDYFLLLAASHFLSGNVKTYRILLSALLGGASSLYIFLPEINLIIDFLFKIFILLVMSFVAFGLVSIKRYIKSVLIFAAVNCGYTGIMMAVWYLFKPNGMLVNNSVVYFNISPVVLVTLTVVGYVVFTFLNYVFSKTSKLAEKCTVKVTADGKTVELSAIVDTGNSIKDVFGMGEIIVVDRKSIELLFENIAFSEKLDNRYRAIPCGTVSGGGLLEGYRCDSGIIKSEHRTVKLSKPVLAVSKTNLPDDYSAIVNPDILS